MPTRIRLSRKERQEGHCTYCRDALGSGDDLVSCLACRVRLHRGCRDELHRCPTIGCTGTWSDRIQVGAIRYTSPLSEGGEVDFGALGRTILTRGCLALVGAGLLAALVAVGGMSLNDRRALRAARTGEARQDHLEALIGYFVEGTPPQRQVARKGLLQIGGRDAAKLLKGLSVLPAGRVREDAAALVAAVALESDQGTRVVAAHLRESDPQVVLLAAEVLRSAEPRRFPPSSLARLRSLANKRRERVFTDALLHLDTSRDSIRAVGLRMRSSDVRVARSAAEALTRLGPRASSAYPDVEQVLLFGPHRWVACSVAGAIGPSLATRTFPLLEKFARRTKDPIERRRALAAMCQIGGAGIRYVIGFLVARKEREGFLISLLTDVGTPQVDLARELGRAGDALNHLSVRAHRRLLKALAALGVRAAPASAYLLAAAKSESREVRLGSARVLQEIETAVPKLREKVRSLNRSVALSAVRGLIPLGGDAAERALLLAAQRAFHHQVQLEALRAFRSRKLVNKARVLKALFETARYAANRSEVRHAAESLRLDLIQRR